MAQAQHPLTLTLITALSQSQEVIQQVEDQQKTIERLFGELAAKQAEVDALKRELRTAQAKDRKWRLQNPQISSPVVLSDEIEHTSRPTTPMSSDARQSSPAPHIQVVSSPPRKRPRTSRDRTPLREVQNAVKAPLSRTEKAVAAIPSLAEDGEETVSARPHLKSPKVDVGAKKDAHERLGGLLAAPAPTNGMLQARTTPPSPKPRSFPPTLRKSSSDLDQREPATRRKPRFLPPKPSKPPTKKLRERPISELGMGDFVYNSEYVEAYDLPGGYKSRGLAAILGDEMSDDELLKEVLGKDAEEKIGKLTKVARENLICEARARKVAAGFAQSKQQQQTTDGGPVQTNYWNTDFPSSMEEKESRADSAVKAQELLNQRYREAIAGNGRWRFRDED